MTRVAAALALAASLTSCVPAVEVDQSPPSVEPALTGTPSESPTPTSPPTRQDIPVNCLNVVSLEYRATLAAPDVVLVQASGQVGLDEVDPVPLHRSLDCMLIRDGWFEHIRYGEFDPTEREAVIERYVQAEAWSGGAEPQPATGIDDAVQIVGASTFTTVGTDWLLSVQTTTDLATYASAMPDSSVDQAVVNDEHPPTQVCEAMLPVPSGSFDWTVGPVVTSSAGESVDTGVWSFCTSPCGQDVCDTAQPGDEVLWWETVTPEGAEALLADAEAGVDGLGVGGSTIDGDGTLVTTSGVEVLVVFDEAIVHVMLPDGMEQGVQIARYVHAPGWQDVPPAG